MSREMFDALMAIVDAKIAEALAGSSSDGGLIERRNVLDLEREFTEAFVNPYEWEHRHD